MAHGKKLTHVYRKDLNQVSHHAWLMAKTLFPSSYMWQIGELANEILHVGHPCHGGSDDDFMIGRCQQWW